MLSWNELERRVDAASRIFVCSHIRPDGDALGSELAMADFLEHRGKQVEIWNPSPTPTRYHFLAPIEGRVRFLGFGGPGPQGDFDLIMVLDTGTWNQLAGLGDFIRQSRAEKLVIDHHRSQDDLGAFRLVDVDAAACGMLVYDALTTLNFPMTAATAEALFVAISTDTGWMRHSNTTPHVFEVMAALTRHGARPAELYRQLYESSTSARLNLLGMMLTRMELLAKGELVTSYIQIADIANAGAHPMDTEDFIGELMGVRGVECAVFFIEQADGGTKVSFRSRGRLDCSRLAEQFRGGGHKQAAGATIATPIDEARPIVLDAVRMALGAAPAP